jgi:hypothetical protein
MTTGLQRAHTVTGAVRYAAVAEPFPADRRLRRRPASLRVILVLRRLRAVSLRRARFHRAHRAHRARVPGPAPARVARARDVHDAAVYQGIAPPF